MALQSHMLEELKKSEINIGNFGKGCIYERKIMEK